MSELVAYINSETGGTVQASVNTDGKLVLSNNTGVAIKVTDNSATGAATNDGGSGFGGSGFSFFLLLFFSNCTLIFAQYI